MSTGKRLLYPYQIFQEQAVSGTNTYLSPTINFQNYDTGGIEIFWTGTLAGTFTLLGSISGAPGTFQPLPSFSVNSPAGSDGNTLIDIWGTGVFWLQLKYVNASGSGTITNATVAGKAF